MIDLYKIGKWVLVEDHIFCCYCGEEYPFDCLITKTTWEDGAVEYSGGYYCPNRGKKLREHCNF